MAGVRVRADVIEPSQFLLANACAHRAVHMVRLDRDARTAFLGRQRLEIVVLERVEARDDLPRGVDVGAEGDGLVHGRGVLGDERGRVTYADLRERIRAADELGRVVHLDFAVRGGDGGAQLLRDVGHCEDEDLVVREQALLDGLAEADAVELASVDRLVVHRTEDHILGFGVILDLVVVDARRRRHVEAFRRDELRVVVHEDEGGLLGIPGRRARGAVGLVADHEIEVRLMGLFVVERLLGLDDLGEGLVGGEDHAEALVRLREQVQLMELADDLVRVRDGGEGQVFDGVAAVVRRPLLLRDGRVRADAHRADRLGGMGRPLVERLAEERERRDEKEDESGRFHFILRDLERGVGLAGAAGHDQLAAVGGPEMGVGGIDGLLLVLTRGAGPGGLRRLLAVRLRLERGPVNGRLGKVGEADLHHRRHLVLQRGLGIRRPVVRRRNPEPT